MAVLLGGALVAACSSDPVSPVDQDLATLKTVTAPFKQFDEAINAGWSTKITDCMADPQAGGMGLHYGKANLIDDSVHVDRPEVLLYEPQAGGKLQLVGVEYIIPVDQWTAQTPPHLFGQDFHVIEAFHVWALHVWVWKSNPSGLYADWNPTVTCANAAAM